MYWRQARCLTSTGWNAISQGDVRYINILLCCLLLTVLA
jgi:hypothetical protein